MDNLIQNFMNEKSCGEKKYIHRLLDEPLHVCERSTLSQIGILFLMGRLQFLKHSVDFPHFRNDVPLLQVTKQNPSNTNRVR